VYVDAMTPTHNDFNGNRVRALPKPREAARLRLLWTAALVLSAASGCLRLQRAAEPSSPDELGAEDHGELLHPVENTEPAPTFVLDGKPFCFKGTNNYYLTYKSRMMVDDVFQQARRMKLKVIRIWGFIDRGAVDGAVPSIDGDGTKDGVYFQHWDARSSKPVLNDGDDGLRRLDYVLHAARRYGIKVIVVLTNNWKEFGGMDQYLKWYGLRYHDQFFTDARVRQAYKDYASALVERVNAIDGTRYRDDPAIFAWELANEPRCKSAHGMDRNEGWDRTTIVRWADEMSGYLRSIDPNHLVAVGDEGFLDGGGSGPLYQAKDGVDHAALTALENVDFGTFHAYPDNWGLGYEQMYHWIEAHIAVARRLGKPTVLEEYGTTVRRDPKTLQISAGWERRKMAYTNWNELMLKRGGNASLFWMLAGIQDSKLLYPDYDHYQVYNGYPTAKLIERIAGEFPERAAACKHAVDVSDLAPSAFVKVKRTTPPARVAADRTTSAHLRGAGRAGPR
jgi:mannan endo-1,4-beta-mannosidase